MKLKSGNKESPVSFCARFARNEEGGITVLTLLLLIIMLVLGGMAVDFMRYESQRAQLQSVSDRAVLAASALSQTRDPGEVVIDFFDKAGYANHIVGEPRVEDNFGSRSVAVRSEIDVNTFYLRLIGIDQLEAQAQSAAVEGTGKVEVSVVLDISGSMGSWVSSEGKTRIQLLREAASGFIDDLLLEEYEDEISVNLVMYSQHVRIGDELWGAISRTPQTISGGGYTHTNPSQCIYFDPLLPRGYSGEIPLGHFGELSFDSSYTYTQVEHVWVNNSHGRICPEHDYEEIITISQDKDALKEAINDLQPTGFTSIHMGMKWGLALLDPSMRDILGGLPGTDPAFAGNRPADYDDSETVKYVILMTDGENVAGNRVRPERYDTAKERVYYDTNRLSNSNHRYTPQSAAQNDIWLQSLCNLAKAEMRVYTIAMGAPQHGVNQMRSCASQPSFAYTTDFSSADGDRGIDEIFETIASQIVALRLNL